jgi:5'(3')-deoxyribonucleotidase
MDGVVADFNKYVSNFLGREIGWGIADLTRDEWQKISQIDNFYYQLELIPESTMMVALCKSFSTRFKISFLTALPREGSMPTARDDKTMWLDKYFPGIPINFGPFSRDKQNWCVPGDILIDDKPENVEQWVAKGGVAILHSGNFDQTISKILAAIDDDTPRLLT